MQDFNSIAKDIINHCEYQKLSMEGHHGLTRYDHSLRVAKSTYKIAKALKLDYVSATRAALLHDFYVDKEINNFKGLAKGRHHPQQALINAETYFNLNGNEANAIMTHMFPLTLKMPATKEGMILNLADTGVALYECSKYKLSMAIGVWLLFVFNLLTFKN